MSRDICFYIGFNKVTHFIKGLQNVKTLNAFFPEVFTSEKETFAKAFSMFNWVLNTPLYLEM